MSFLPSSWHGCFETVSTTLLSSCRTLLPELTAEEVVVSGRSFKIIRLLGEGGYSFVYVVREAGNQSALAHGNEYALKKVLASSEEQLKAARLEIAVMSRLRHQNLLPLLGSAIGPAPESGSHGGARHVAYMLFPLYPAGSLADLGERLAMEGRSLPAAEIMHIFVQVARGLQAMHRTRPHPLIHRDVKPHNVLLRKRHPDDSRRPGRYQAVLMDFGSVQEGRQEIRSRQQALAMQEDAERNCSAPYRAPELYDVASECTIDERVDIWSLGCLLYFMMYLCSPFERVLNEGGSLMLAVLNGYQSISWPASDHPEELRQLVKFCLNSDPSKRPHIDEAIRQATGCDDRQPPKSPVMPRSPVSRRMELSAVSPPR